MRLRLGRCLAGLPVSKAVLVVLFVAAGLYLRLDSLSSQLLLDDEWHSIGVARHHSLAWLWTNYCGPGATSIPVNVYQRAVLCLFGWNEWLIRLPNVVCGVLMILGLPWLLRRLVGFNVVLWFLFFMATSPFLIFYSRSSRPYAIFALLSFLSILTLCLWIRDGTTSALIVFVVSAALAVYVHLFAAPTIAACFVYWLATLLRRRLCSQRRLGMRSEWRGFLVAAVCTLLIVVVLYWQPYRNGMMAKLLADPSLALEQYPWSGFYEYLCGTASVAWLCVLGALAVTGSAVLVSGGGIGLLVLLGIAVAANVAAVLATHAECVDVPVVFTRYCIVSFPAFYVLCAIGGEWLRSWISRRSQWPLSGVIGNGALALAAVGYLWATPNRALLTLKPNSFAMHSAFIESYRETDWERPYRSQVCREFAITEKDVPAFYAGIAGDNAVRAIVEYPMPIEDHYNIHYYYEHFHKKRVYVAYVPGEQSYPALAGQACPPMPPVGAFLYHADGRQQDVDFTNLIDIWNPTAIRRTGASCFVVHKNYFAEIRAEKTVAMAPQAQAVSVYLRGLFGEPCYEDSRLWVYAIGDAPRAACAARR